jgi:hypothetical protein
MLLRTVMIALLVPTLLWAQTPPSDQPSASQPAARPTENVQPKPEPDLRGTAQMPLAVEIVPTTADKERERREWLREHGKEHEEHELVKVTWWLVYGTIGLAVGTIALAGFTALLFWFTRDLARSAKEESERAAKASDKALAASTRATKTLTRVERAYLTGGGDVVNRGGRRCFRVDVANYGKTAAYLTHYEIRFAAKLADVQAEPRKVYEPQKQHVFDDRIAPDNKTKVIGYEEMDPADAEIIYGCFWYTDWRKKKERYFRFILGVDLTSRTQPDVDGVDDSYRDWS